MRDLKFTLKELTKTHLTTEQQLWWQTTLDGFENDENQQCDMCKELRDTMKQNGRRKVDNEDVQKEKGSRRSKAYKTTLNHLSADENKKSQ